MSPRFLRLQDPHRFLRSYILQHSWTIIIYNVVFPSIPYILNRFQSLHPKSLPSPSYPSLTATPHPSVLTQSLTAKITTIQFSPRSSLLQFTPDTGPHSPVLLQSPESSVSLIAYIPFSPSPLHTNLPHLTHSIVPWTHTSLSIYPDPLPHLIPQKSHRFQSTSYFSARTPSIHLLYFLTFV